MVYLHTNIQWEETSVQSFWFRSLSVSPRGMLSTEKKSLRFKGQSAVLSLQYSFILYIWRCLLSHLLGLSHLQVLSLSSSWRSLQYSSVCLQEHRQVTGSCTNKRFLFSEQWSQHGSQTASWFVLSRFFFRFLFRPLPLPFRGFFSLCSFTSFFNLHSHALCSVKLMKISFCCLWGFILLISIVML